MSPCSQRARVFLYLLGTVLFSAGIWQGCGSRGSTAGGLQVVSLSCRNSALVRIQLHVADGRSDILRWGGLIVVPDFSRSSQDWDVFVHHAAERGLVVAVTEPLPESGQTPEAAVSTLTDAVSCLIPEMAKYGVGSEKIALLAEGRSAAAALRARNTETLAGRVLLSPVWPKSGPRPLELPAESSVVPCFLLSGDDDAAGRESAQAIYEALAGLKEIRLYPTASQGVDLLDLFASAEAQIFQWLETVLGTPKISRVPVADVVG